jgi:hypothetical protein
VRARAENVTTNLSQAVDQLNIAAARAITHIE